ncbi:MAG: tetratricopeptide repeat protein [Bacteroidetes bacterium]|nr:tetratricopeptide repeat protein [Bacteroidota bacterium]
MKQKFKIVFIFFFLFTLICKAGDYEKIDSLKAVYDQTTDPLDKFNTGYRIVRALALKRGGGINEYYQKCSEINSQLNTPALAAKLEFMKALSYFNDNENAKTSDALKISIPLLIENNLKEELADAYSLQGLNCIALSEYIRSIESFEKSNTLCVELNEQIQICENNLYLGRNYESMGNNTKALKCYQNALSIAENLKKDRLLAEAKLCIGALYSDGINQKLGTEYLSKAAEEAEKLQDTSLLISTYIYLANSYYYNKEYTSALKMYEKVKTICTKYGSRNTYAGTLGNMGNVYADMGNTEKAMELQLEAVRIFDEIGDKQGLTICYSAIGIDYLNMKEYEKALEYFNKSLPMAQEMQSLEDLIEIHLNLSRLFEETKDFEKAYLNYKLYKQYSDSVYNSSNSQKLTELELNYQFESKQKEAALMQQLANERFSRTIYAAIACGLVLLIIVFLVVRANRQRKKANEQLTISNNAIRLQKEELENHKKEITDSINYAKRIQESILPPDAYWKNMLPDSFIFYRPKDIVSGDFYWIEQKNDSVCFAAVDCTGHGVPGALMSVVGFNLLTQAVNEMNLTIPSEILKHLDYGVTKTLRQSSDGKGVKDGMDLSLCSLNLKTNVLQYAGAFNSLYYISGGKFHEIKADKFPIGVNLDGKVDEYTNHSISLQKGDCIYLFSDGYADQFGGPKGKKYKYNQLKELLHKIYLLPIDEQHQQLSRAFDAWKGDLEQVDDVVIIGVRV